ncbi:proline dehydrogenase [Rhodococcus spelaei]|uniref:proline dehydrogenase n=1 Tax=Rhodococcus spelaei TaxID=2546320 RepID=A0A541BNE3_9NOCA|nr:proline dehydrogenase family protein [Rhodococcus spelaei]TQF73839.1 proline dehydrogenase [Rhodococcus spelaei]
MVPRALANPLRPAILAAARSPRVKSAITRAPGTRSIVTRFIAGETRSDALVAARTLLDSGRMVSIDHLGEDTTDLTQARAAVAEYRSLLAELARLPEARTAGETRRLEVSVKLSALGQALPSDGRAVALEHAHHLCAAAQEAGVWVTVDAEDHTTTDSTLSIVTELRADYPWLGTVLQAYLRRTEGDCRDLSGPGSRIRLCKGAYREPESVAYQSRAEVDASYLRCLTVLMDGQGYPMVASHDPVMVDAAAASAAGAGRGAGDYEHQMLYGIRDVEQARLAAGGAQVRVYVPYGGQWYGYFMRRLAERPANLTFFLRSLATRG